MWQKWISDRTSRHSAFAVVTILVAGLSLSTTAGSERKRSEDRVIEEQFFEDRERGWHWYEVIPLDEMQKEPEGHTTAPPESSKATGDDAGPPALSAEWMRVNLPKLRDAAIDAPTETNVTAYFYAQRIMMDKAQIFSDVAQTVVRKDPLLDENLRLPFASAARAATLAAAGDTKRTIIEDLAQKAGLWVFYDETCEFCERQIPPLNRFADRHGMEMRIISRQGRALRSLNSRVQVLPDVGQFETLGINFTPTVMLVVPPEGFYVISQGFIDYTSLIDRLVAAGNQYGLISAEQYYAARPTARGVLEASMVGDSEEVDWNNTDSWVPFIQREIERTYGIEQSRR